MTDEIPLRAAVITPEPYVVAGPWPYARPPLCAFSRTHGRVSAVDVSDQLSEALSVDLGARSRWVADPATLIGNGDGTWRWEPSQGSDLTARWKFFAEDNLPATVPDYDYKLRNGRPVTHPAFVFRGGQWCRLNSFPDGLEGCAVLLVARLRHANDGIFGSIIESYKVGGDPDADEADIYLRKRRDTIRSSVEGNHTLDLIRNTRRPHLVGFSHDTGVSHQLVMDRDRNIKTFGHPDVDSYDMTWFLGRNGGAYDVEKTMIMDVLDIAIWDHALSRKALIKKAHMLNAVYGVTG